MMFFTSESEKAKLVETRDRLYNAIDRTPFFHVGHFMTWYAAVEFRMTLLLACATETKNLEAFELLTYGLDARSKIERFKKAAEGRIGPNLDKRLDTLSKKIIKVRNKVAHTYVVPDQKQEHIGFVSLNQFPTFFDDRPKCSKSSERMTMLELFEMGAWLELFSKDLASITKPVGAVKTFEIAHPLSPLRKG